MESWSSILLHFSPDALTEIYLEQYKYEFGEKKLREVIEKIEYSPKVNDFITTLIQRNFNPKAKEIEILMNTISYFMFSKEETLCLGGLATIVLWQNKRIIYNGVQNEEENNEFENKVTQICVSLISNCSQNKYNKSNNFFQRFIKKINIIGREQGIS